MSAPFLDLDLMQERANEVRIAFADPLGTIDVDSIVAVTEDVDALVDRITELEDEVAILRHNLERTTCPLPLKGDDGTIEGCIAKGHCGCHHHGRARITELEAEVARLRKWTAFRDEFLSNPKEAGG